MCGIVGLFLKQTELEPRLGTMLCDMMTVLSDRGPDSAGFAVYAGAVEDHVKLTLSGADETALAAALSAMERALRVPLAPTIHGGHAVVAVPAGLEGKARAWVDGRDDVGFVAAGTRMELYKAVGRPEAVAERYDLAGMSGTHGICHTRMATESAVTTLGAHPFSTGRDQCLVHNGSLSNHNALRRQLRRAGMRFETDNDSEVAACYLTWRMDHGASLKEALTAGLADLDGFYTFVVGTENGFAVLRDPIACKPAIIAETDDYVAFGSEYRALAVLPRIDTARVFEPAPATVYAWERA
jgi:glutamate synthase domain-containing protein 1